MNAVLLYLLFSLYLGQAVAQNLVKNPGFEQLKGGVIGVTGISGTPDIASVEGKVVQYPPYFNAYQSETPSRQLTEIAFGEVCLCQWFSYEASELTQLSLSRPLRKNQEYVVSLYTIRASAIEPPIQEVTVHFVNKPLPATREVYGLPEHPLTEESIPYTSLTNATQTPLASRTTWTQVSAVYKAKGGERHLLLGNFKGANAAALGLMNPETGEENEETRSAKTKGTYYCYDNISVVPKTQTDQKTRAIPEATPPQVAGAVTPLAIGATITLGDVNFATGEHAIQPPAFPLLDSLAAFMKREPQAVLHIQGHTDAVGLAEDNLALSQRRAAAVDAYLVRAGVERGRVTSEGLGEQQPKADNESEAGRALNRRVEIFIRRQPVK